MAKRTFNYTQRDLNNPRGANNLSSEAMFFQRSLYKEAIYPPEKPFPLDTWYRSPLYGKVDRRQNTIMLRNDKLKQFPDSTEVAIDFVVDAFEGLKNHIRAAAGAGKLNGTTSGIISNLTLQGAWERADTHYLSYLEGLFSGFLSYYIPTRHHKIKNFETFIPEMKSFLLQTCSKVPITQTNFVLTRSTPRRSSGLVVSVGNFEAGDDSMKYQEFISNPNFEVYRTCAKNYGFYVDKNMPWLLTADISSRAMRHYMSKYKGYNSEVITSSNFFHNYYNFVCLKDLPTLKRLFKNFYNQYINIFPFYEEITRPCLACPEKTEITQHYRAGAGEGEIDQFMTELDWLRFYIDVREAEAQGTGIKVPLLKKRIRDIYRHAKDPFIAESEGVLAINRLYRNYIYTRSMVNLSR